MVLLEISNIVAVANLKDKLDLKELSGKLKNTELINSKVWLKMRLQPDNKYIAFYASGKFLVTGVKTFEELSDTVERVIHELLKSDLHVELDEIKVINIVLSDKIELNLTLDEIIIELNASNSSYEPEQFPGLFYKDSDGISYTLFSSGKIIITGLTDIDLAKKNIDKFKELLMNLDLEINKIRD